VQVVTVKLSHFISQPSLSLQADLDAEARKVAQMEELRRRDAVKIKELEADSRNAREEAGLWVL